MKIKLEMTLPKELENLVSLLTQAALVYTEAATSFPAAEQSNPNSASAPIAEPVAEAAPATPPSEPPVDLKRLTAVLKGNVDLQNRAASLIKSQGMQRLSDLSVEQLMDLVAELGVAV